MTVKLTPFPGVSTAVRHFAGTPDWLAVLSRGPVSTARGASVLAPCYSPAFCQNGLRKVLKIIGLLEARWTQQLGFQTLANGVFLGRVGKELRVGGFSVALYGDAPNPTIMPRRHPLTQRSADQPPAL